MSTSLVEIFMFKLSMTIDFFFTISTIDVLVNPVVDFLDAQSALLMATSRKLTTGSNKKPSQLRDGLN